MLLLALNLTSGKVYLTLKLLVPLMVSPVLKSVEKDDVLHYAIVTDSGGDCVKLLCFQWFNDIIKCWRGNCQHISDWYYWK